MYLLECHVMVVDWDTAVSWRNSLCTWRLVARCH